MRGRGRTARRETGKMNKTEAAYAEHLERKRLAGQIARWDFEPEKLRIGESCWLCPDFRVVLPDGVIEFHDTKGTKMATRADGTREPTPWMEEDARVKLRAAAELHPYAICVAYQVPATHGGGWMIEEM